MAASASPIWIGYADGSCLGNPGPGGWGVLLTDPDGTTRELAGAHPSTTNNRMEITAAIEALRNLPPGAPIKLHSDSQYVIKTMTLGWKRRENLDLWKILDEETLRHRVQWEWVRGHNGDPHNERADELARSAAEGRAPRARKMAGALTQRSTADEDMEGRSAAELNPLLRPDETLRHCQGCRRVFVSAGDARFCSLAGCQLRARRKSS